MSLIIGQILNNRYRIDGLLGQGGFGAVYLAYDLNLEGPVAIKESLDASLQAEANFKREAMLLFKLDHPNLPRVLDRLSLPGQGLYLVMQYIAGEDLETILEEQGNQPVGEEQALDWIAQVCDALNYLHTQSPPIIHRDIKPANIRITPEGKVVLVDFGIAKLYDPIVKTTVAARGGSPGYAPPEQYGQRGTDVRSDIYSLGATLYKLLTGIDPPGHQDITSGDASPPSPARALNLQVSERISTAVAKAMQLNRSLRFESVAEFRAALFGNEPSTFETKQAGLKDGKIPLLISQPAQQSLGGTTDERSLARPSEETRLHTQLAWQPLAGKSWTVTFLLCLFLGFLGAHRFYTGYKRSGIIMLITLGGLGVWWIIDLILILSNKFKDNEKNPIIQTRGKLLRSCLASLLVSSLSFILLAFLLLLLFDSNVTSGQSGQAATQQSNFLVGLAFILGITFGIFLLVYLLTATASFWTRLGKILPTKKDL